MKKVIYIVCFIFLSMVFSACSNMTIGFEENSIFYTEPKKEVTSQTKKIPSKPEPKSLEAENIKIQESTPSTRIEKTLEKEDVEKKDILEKKDQDTENETTFSYDPYEGE